MQSNEQIFKGVNARIFEWIDDAKEDAKSGMEAGMDEDSVYDDAEESHRELVEEIEKLEYFLDEDQIVDLIYFAGQAFLNVESYIFDTLFATA